MGARVCGGGVVLTPLSSSQFNQLLAELLKQQSYRSREVFKLRSGVGDGYVYNFEEIALIFKSVPRVVIELFEDGIQQLCRSLEERLTAPPVNEIAVSIVEFAAKISAPDDTTSLYCLGIEEHVELWSELATIQHQRVEWLGWSSELQAEILLVEPHENVNVHEAMFVAVRRNENSAEVTLVGSLMALSLRTNRDGFGSFQAFCWNRLKGNTPGLTYFNFIVWNHERTNGWLRNLGISKDDPNFIVVNSPL